MRSQFWHHSLAGVLVLWQERLAAHVPSVRIYVLKRRSALHFAYCPPSYDVHGLRLGAFRRNLKERVRALQAIGLHLSVARPALLRQHLT